MFYQGKIEPFWKDLHRYLDYQREPFNCDTDIDLWRKQGYSQEYFTGVMYDMKRSLADWIDPFFSVFEGKNIGVSFYRMDTCNILPYHRDTYKYYRTLFNIKDLSIIRRAVIFLEDWKPGHIFEIENIPITNWKAGEWVLWENDSPHMAANLGLEPRYTAQITFTDV